MLPAPEPVGQDAAVAPLVGLPALLDAKEHHPLGPICPELEPGPVGQRDVAPEPGDRGGRVPEDLQLHVGILLLVCKKLVLAVLGELGRAGQSPGLERGLGSGGRMDNKYEFMIYGLVTFAKKRQMINLLWSHFRKVFSFICHCHNSHLHKERRIIDNRIKKVKQSSRLISSIRVSPKLSDS